MCVEPSPAEHVIAARHVVLIGLMAAGKSPVGRALADQLGLRCYDSDEELASRAGLTPADLEARVGTEALHHQEATILLDLLGRSEPSVVAAAASTVEDPTCRAALRERAFVVWLDADLNELGARARDNPGRPLRHDVRAQLQESSKRREPIFRQLADTSVDTTSLDVEAVAASVIEALPGRGGCHRG